MRWRLNAYNISLLEKAIWLFSTWRRSPTHVCRHVYITWPALSCNWHSYSKINMYACMYACICEMLTYGNKKWKKKIAGKLQVLNTFHTSRSTGVSIKFKTTCTIKTNKTTKLVHLYIKCYHFFYSNYLDIFVFY